MLRYKSFLEEGTDNSHWSSGDHVVVYHGTHIKNVPGILKNGINNKDPKTGMVSVAIGNHGFNVAHGYAAMSGEHAFRQAGAKAVQVAPQDRAVVVAHLPREWVDKHVDRDFGGNPDSVKKRLKSRNIHTMHVVKTGEAFAAHETPELRFSQPIPAKYIKGWKQK